MFLSASREGKKGITSKIQNLKYMLLLAKVIQKLWASRILSRGKSCPLQLVVLVITAMEKDHRKFYSEIWSSTRANYMTFFWEVWDTNSSHLERADLTEVLPFTTAYLWLQGEHLFLQVLSGFLFLFLLLLQVVLLLFQLPNPTAQVEFLASFFLKQLLLHKQAYSKFSLVHSVLTVALGYHPPLLYMEFQVWLFFSQHFCTRTCLWRHL